MDRILTNGRKLLTSNNNKLLLSRERTTGQRSGLRLNGTTNKINIPAQALADFTFSTWFRKDASKTASFLSNSGTNILGLNASNQLTFLGLAAGISYSIHKTWSYLVVTREAGVVKASLNKGAFVTIGTDATSVTVNELGNLFDGRLEAPALFNIANGAHKPHNYLESSVPNLIEQWKLNEGTGTTVYGTKGNNGTVTGTATWTTPSLMNYVGRCVRLKGEHIKTPVISNYRNKITLEAWARYTSGIGGLGSIFSKNGFIDFVVVINSSRKIEYVLRNTLGQFVTGIGTSVIPIDTWAHTALTHDGENTKLYVNGVLEHSSSGLTGNIGNSAKEIYMGCYENGSNVLYGSLDDARVWNYARTQTQIQENMNRTLGREPGLVLNMGFESDYYDASGYGNHGTPVGSPVLEVTDNDKLLLNAPIN
jgi:hypothetical protein